MFRRRTKLLRVWNDMGVINNNILILVWSKPFIGNNGGMFVRNECDQSAVSVFSISWLCCSCRWSSVLQHEPARPQTDHTHSGRIAAVSPAVLGSGFHALQPAERRTLLQSEPRYCSHYSDLMSSRTLVLLIQFHCSCTSWTRQLSFNICIWHTIIFLLYHIHFFL